MVSFHLNGLWFIHISFDINFSSSINKDGTQIKTKYNVSLLKPYFIEYRVVVHSSDAMKNILLLRLHCKFLNVFCFILQFICYMCHTKLQSFLTLLKLAFCCFACCFRCKRAREKTFMLLAESWKFN